MHEITSPAHVACAEITDPVRARVAPLTSAVRLSDESVACELSEVFATYRERLDVSEALVDVAGGLTSTSTVMAAAVRGLADLVMADVVKDASLAFLDGDIAQIRAEAGV